MKYFVFFFVFLLFSTVMYSQQIYKDVIHLKNGDIAKGVIIENVPNDYVKLETDNGSIITFKYVDIAKFTKDKVSNEVQKQKENVQPLPTNQNPTNVQSPQTNTQPRIESIPYNSISFGYGNSYGGLGTKYEYKFGTIAIHGGVGYFPPPADYAESTVLFSGGIKLFFSSNDMYLNLQFGTFGVEATQLSYTTIYSTTKEKKQKTLYGPTILLGNTILIGKSVGLNCAVGISYNMEKIDWSDNYKVLYAFDLGLSKTF